MSNNIEQLAEIVKEALFKLQNVIENDPYNKLELLRVVMLFLQSVMSTAVGLVEIRYPGCEPILYADIEAMAKIGGIKKIKELQLRSGLDYSISNIAPDDTITAISYLSKEVNATLYKSLHELPIKLRTPDMLLYGVEALIAGLLKQEFNNSDAVLEEICAHVRIILGGAEKPMH